VTQAKEDMLDPAQNAPGWLRSDFSDGRQGTHPTQPKKTRLALSGAPECPPYLPEDAFTGVERLLRGS